MAVRVYVTHVVSCPFQQESMQTELIQPKMGQWDLLLTRVSFTASLESLTDHAKHPHYININLGDVHPYKLCQFKSQQIIFNLNLTICKTLMWPLI